MEIVKNYIDGKSRFSRSNNYLALYEPATGQIYGEVIDSDNHDIEDAIVAAENAFPKWSGLPLKERANFLKKIAERMQTKLDDLANFESRDTGKPISLARSLDIPRAIENFKFFAEYAEKFEWESRIDSDKSLNNILRNPLGVVCCISPWNLPLYLFTWKVAPALVTGNTVIAKPSEVTPYTAYKLGQICSEIGLPKGVLNIINGHGSSVGNNLIKHKKIKAISFTGGTSTGKKIFQNSSESFKKLSLEMGGKNPAIIFEDCNYNLMLDTVIKSSFTNQGQVCLCSSRLIIESSIYEKFKYDFCEKISEIIIDDPEKEETQFSAISSKDHFNKINSYINLAIKDRGKIIIGGNKIKLPGRCEKGWFIEPTVIEGLSQRSRVKQEEIFGPVVTVEPFKSEKDAIDIANETKYGLSATIWTRDLQKSERISKNIQAGVLWVNCWMLRDLRTPFGGMKNSGLGREGGDEALRFFTEQKNICMPI